MSFMPCPTQPTPLLAGLPTLPSLILRSSWRSSSLLQASSSFSRTVAESNTWVEERNVEPIPHCILTLFWVWYLDHLLFLMHILTFQWDPKLTQHMGKSHPFILLCLYWNHGGYGVCHFYFSTAIFLKCLCLGNDFPHHMLYFQCYLCVLLLINCLQVTQFILDAELEM